MALAIAIGQNAGTLISDSSEDLTEDFFDTRVPFNSADIGIAVARRQPCAAIGKAVLIGDTDNEPFFAAQCGRAGILAI